MPMQLIVVFVHYSWQGLTYRRRSDFDILQFANRPRRYSTRWFNEGIATFMETWMAGGLGRAIGGWDEMTFRTMVRDDAYIYDVVGLESEGNSSDFQTGANSYLYGTRFLTWVCYTYGPDKLLQWVSRSENTKRYFAARFKQVYGIAMEQAWKMWIADERKFQEANLAEIRKYPVTVPQRITAGRLGSVSRAYFDPEDNVIYAGTRYPAHLGSIAAIHVDTGKIDELKDIKGPGLYLRHIVGLGPPRAKALLHHRQQRFSRPERLRRRHASFCAAANGHSHWGSGFRCSGQLVMGRAP